MLAPWTLLSGKIWNRVHKFWICSNISYCHCIQCIQFYGVSILTVWQLLYCSSDFKPICSKIINITDYSKMFAPSSISNCDNCVKVYIYIYIISFNYGNHHSILSRLFMSPVLTCHCMMMVRKRFLSSWLSSEGMAMDMMYETCIGQKYYHSC